MELRHRLAGILGVVALLLAGAPARPESDQDRARSAVESGEVQPLKSILRIVRGQYDGQVLDADLSDRGGSWMYRVRVLTKDGRVLDIDVDGRSGRVVAVQGGG